MKVKFKKLREDAVVPSYAREGDAGLDVTAIDFAYITDDQVCYSTGIALEIPEGHVCLIYPRSSIRNKDLVLSNSVGVLDSGYRGELTLTFNKIDGKHSRIYYPRDRVGQLVIIPYPHIELEEVEELSESERGEGGHGSTGA